MVMDTKDKILEVSSRLFYEQGYSNTSLRQIADACGIQLGNLYYYFKKKNELIAYFITALYSDFAQRLQQHYGKIMESYCGVVMAEYLFLRFFASDIRECRIFVEASESQDLRAYYGKVHHDVMMSLVPRNDQRLSPRDAFIASSYCCGGGIQMMIHCYNNFSTVDFDELFLPGLKTRLLMLGLSPEEAQSQLDLAISLAHKVHDEGIVQTSLWTYDA